MTLPISLLRSIAGRFSCCFIVFLILLAAPSVVSAQEIRMDASTNGTTITGCTGTLTDSGGAAGSYQNSENYTVTLATGIPGEAMRLLFTAWDTEANFDKLYIYDGPDTTYPMVPGSPFHGTASAPVSIPAGITGSGSELTLRFVSDGSATGLGFTASICPPDTVEIDEYSGQTLMITPGTFFDSGGAGGDYTPGEDHTITFCASTGHVATMLFTSFALGAGDTLYAYDGTTTASPLLGSWTGSVSPGFIGSSGQCLTVRFISDSSEEGTGWAATIGEAPCKARWAGATVSSAANGSTAAWTLPAFANVHPENTYAGLQLESVVPTLADLETTQALEFSNFYFDIPANAQVLGITARVHRRNGGTANVYDANVRLRLPDGTLSPANMADLSTPWLESTSVLTQEYKSYGGLWGWTPAQLTANNLRSDGLSLIIEARRDDAAGQAIPHIESVELLVCYVEGAPVPNLSAVVTQKAAPYDCGATGQVVIHSVTGGTGGPVEYSLDGVLWQSSNTFSNLSPGDYRPLIRNTGTTTAFALKWISLNTANTILQNGDAVVTCAPDGTGITLAIKSIQRVPAYMQEGATGHDLAQFISPATGVKTMWNKSDFGGYPVFSTTFDTARNIYTGPTNLYSIGYSPGTPAAVYRIDAVTGAASLLTTLPGSWGIGGIDADNAHNQLFVVSMDDGKIHRIDMSTGSVLQSHDPFTPDSSAPGEVAPLAERILAVAYNEAENRVYYSVWANDAANTGIPNTIRSVELDAAGNMLTATDSLEITLPGLNPGGFSMPLSDMEFNAGGNVLIVGETGFHSTNMMNMHHQARMLRFNGGTGAWTQDAALPPGNTSLKYHLGEIGGGGTNARGGVAFGFSGMDENGSTVGEYTFVAALADGVRFMWPPASTVGQSYGIQYMSLEGGNPWNSGVYDIDADSINQDKGVYGDLDICFGTCTPPKVAHLGNLVWLDEDSNGLQDEGERGIPNVTVNVYDAAGGLVASTVTDIHGGWSVTVPGGSYFADVVEATLPVGLTQSPYTLASADLGNQDQSTGAGDYGYTMTVAAGGQNLTGDFGYNYNPAADVLDGSGTAALGDRVWIDVDGDGVQDPDEAGLGGVSLTLCTAGPDGRFGTLDDVTVSTAVTDAAGYYIFDDLAAGAYVVKVTTDLSATYVQTGDPDHFAMVGGVNDGATTVPVILAPGDVFLNVDFGYQPGPAQSNCVGDYVWLDLDADGSQGATEPVLSGVTVSLINDLDGDGVWDAGEPVIATDVTSDAGLYHFRGLPDGDYLVWVSDTGNVLSGLTPTWDFDGTGTPGISAVDLDSAGTNPNDYVVLTHDFGYTPEGQSGATGAIGDYVWLDADRDGVQDAGESGIEGVTVELYDGAGATLLGTALTDKSGRYWFPALDPSATYKVHVVDANFVPGGVLHGMENTWDADNALASPDSTSVVDLAAAGTDGNNDTDGVDNNINPGQDFGYAAPLGSSGSIGDLVWLDQNADGISQGADGPDGQPSTDDDEPGIAGVTVALYRDLNGNSTVDPGEPMIATTVTDNDGTYLFTGLPYGTYVVDVTDDAGVLYGYWHSTGTAATNNNSQTDAYAAEITSGAPEHLAADFGYYVEPASLGNYVFRDNNDDDVQSTGDTGIPGVEVTLTILWPNATTTVVRTLTDETGHYSFAGLLLDENHASGSGPTTDPNAPAITVSAGLPVFTISIAAGQSALAGFDAVAANTGTSDRLDGDSATGVVARPVQGLTNVTAQSPASGENAIASYDFGYVAGKPLTYEAFTNINDFATEEAADPAADPDGDGVSNLLEFAFCTDPKSGVQAHCALEIKEGPAAGQVQACIRQVTGITGVTYILEGAASLAPAMTWTDVTTLTTSSTSNGDGTDTVCYEDLESLGSAYADGTGYFRVRVELDIDGDTNIDATSYTAVFGYNELLLGQYCQTCSAPLESCALIGLTLDGATVPSLDTSSSTGTTDIRTQFTAGSCYYLEMTSGPLTGHRFEVDTTATLAATNGHTLVLDATSLRNTQSPLPATLDGTCTVRKHWTFDELFPPAAFTAGTSVLNADKILTYDSAAAEWTTWSLLVPASPRWTTPATGVTPRGSRCVAPGEGFYIHRYTAGPATLSVMQTGEVRAHAMCVPLVAGSNLMAPGWPMDLTPNQLELTLADGFQGGRNLNVADQILNWHADFVPGAANHCYRTNWIVNAGATSPYRYWTPAGDPFLPDKDNSVLFPRGHAAFLKLQSAHPDYCQPLPWGMPTP